GGRPIHQHANACRQRSTTKRIGRLGRSARPGRGGQGRRRGLCPALRSRESHVEHGCIPARAHPSRQLEFVCSNPSKSTTDGRSPGGKCVSAAGGQGPSRRTRVIQGSDRLDGCLRATNSFYVGGQFPPKCQTEQSVG